jgi:hypothetical protein
MRISGEIVQNFPARGQFTAGIVTIGGDAGWTRGRPGDLSAGRQ